MIVDPTSDCPRVIESPVAPVLHVYVNAPKPSSSAIVLDAVSTPSSIAVPVMVTAPVGASLTLTTAAVASLTTLSDAPNPSV